MKALWRTAWDFVAEGYWMAADFVKAHPHITIWIGLAYVLVRR